MSKTPVDKLLLRAAGRSVDVKPDDTAQAFRLLGLLRAIKRVGADSKEVRKCADFMDHAEQGICELLGVCPGDEED